MRLTKKNMESLKYKGGPADGNSVQTSYKKFKTKKHRFGSKVNGADKITIYSQPDMFEWATFLN